jgi:hypothetical protein
MLDISSNSKGILITRLSTAQRIAIGTPAEGLLVFDTDTKGFWYFSLVKEPNHKLDIDMSRLKSPEFKKWMDR